MKLSLVVLTPGKMEGKAIPITLPQFIVGRDPQCQLRPASPMVSKRHCIITMKELTVSVRDCGSTNGTFINGDKVTGDCDLKDGDKLRIGPLEFRVLLEAPAAVASPALKAVPRPRGAAASEDDVAALLLGGEEGNPARTVAFDSSQEIPTGSTLMEAIPNPQDPNAQAGQEGKGSEREKVAKEAAANTSTAAKSILEKYMRRPRS